MGVGASDLGNQALNDIFLLPLPLPALSDTFNFGNQASSDRAADGVSNFLMPPASMLLRAALEVERLTLEVLETECQSSYYLYQTIYCCLCQAIKLTVASKACF